VTVRKRLVALFVATIPIVTVFFFAQKYFIKGITLSGMAGK
jgi:ABC-type glycerol-3-phosphate transport system permease component